MGDVSTGAQVAKNIAQVLVSTLITPPTVEGGT